MKTTVTGRNQITVPAQIVKHYQLKPGSRIEWQIGETPDGFYCRVLPDPKKLASTLRGAGRRYLREGIRHPHDALMDERASEAKSRASAL